MQALELIDENEFDAVLLDIMMPELDGLSVCRAVRRTNDVPIIFLTALSDEEDKLLGYELGADDYVTKPFTMSVLYAKTMALIKRNPVSYTHLQTILRPVRYISCQLGTGVIPKKAPPASRQVRRDARLSG